MKVFITGGSGFIGRHLVSCLKNSGHQIRMLVHKRICSSANGIEQVEGDINRFDTFATHLNGCDATINLVGIIREFSGRGITFDRLHAEATRNIVQATKEAGITRFIQMSALGARSNAPSDYHRSKFKAEETVRDSGLGWTIFQPSVVFGPEDAFINQLAGYIRNFPAVPVIGNGNYRLQPISVDDVARCFTMALGMEETVGKTYQLCGPDRFDYKKMLDTIGNALGKSTVITIYDPLYLMKLVVPLLQRFSFFPITMDQIQMLLEESICDGDWQKTFSFQPEHFAEGIQKYLHR